MRKPPEEFQTWTQVLESIESNPNKKWLLKKYKTLYYVARFGNSGCVPMEAIRVKTLYRYVEAERNGYVHPKKRVFKPKVWDESIPPF